MKYLVLAASVLSLFIGASTAYAVPICDGPNFDLTDQNGKFVFSEVDEAQKAEQQLRSMGIDANNTRFWNGCIQTFVTDKSGHSQMRFFDPDTYREVPVN